MRRVVMDGTREFASVRDAAKHIIASGAGKLNTVGSNISHVASKERGTAYGHVWSYKDDKRDLVAVVRCRDCAYLCHRKYKDLHVYHTCSYFDSYRAEVELDGYCAWAKRKG